MVGTLVFNTLAPGNAQLSLADNGSPVGPFYSAITSNPQTVNYTGASVTISAVPLPNALWLMMSGIGVFGAAIRRKNPL